jgi:hypothetical protein
MFKRSVPKRQKRALNVEVLIKWRQRHRCDLWLGKAALRQH